MIRETRVNTTTVLCNINLVEKLYDYLVPIGLKPKVVFFDSGSFRPGYNEGEFIKSIVNYSVSISDHRIPLKSVSPLQLLSSSVFSFTSKGIRFRLGKGILFARLNGNQLQRLQRVYGFTSSVPVVSLCTTLFDNINDNKSSLCLVVSDHLIYQGQFKAIYSHIVEPIMKICTLEGIPIIIKNNALFFQPIINRNTDVGINKDNITSDGIRKALETLENYDSSKRPLIAKYFI